MVQKNNKYNLLLDSLDYIHEDIHVLRSLILDVFYVQIAMVLFLVVVLVMGALA